MARRRLDGLVARTRRLFFLLVLISLLLLVLRPLAATDVATFAVLAASCAVLVGLWTVRLATGRIPLVLDPVEAAAIGSTAMVFPDPAVVFTVAFSAFWYRSLFGATGRIVLHGSLIAAAMAGVMTARDVPFLVAMASVPSMALTITVGRYLALSMVAREQAQLRDAALVRLGNGLIGVTDAATIRALMRPCVSAIAAATPDLQVMMIIDTPDGPAVEEHIGGPDRQPTILPAAALPLDCERHGPQPPADPQTLAVATGLDTDWLVLAVPEALGRRILLGGPRRVLDDAIVAVQSMLNQVTLAMQSSASHQNLSAQANTDSLTGLANRKAFDAALRDGLADTRRGVTLLLLDLDDFKIVNDGLGHSAGDELLRQVAQRLRCAVRGEHLCARLGGDEFAVVLGDPSEDVTLVAQRLVDRISAPVSLRGRMIYVGASVGVAFAAPHGSADELVHQADVAMYAAKAKGKNRFQLFDPRLLKEGEPRDDLETELMTAAQSRLVVHYQPILSTHDDRCIAVEAFARWQHPTRGLLHHGEFIELAERIGAIVDIGTAVLRKACEDVREWGERHGHLALHINVSAAQLSDGGFVAVVRDCVRDFTPTGRQLVLEIVDSSALHSPALRDVLDALIEVGAAIAVDDFGRAIARWTRCASCRSRSSSSISRWSIPVRRVWGIRP